jgi:hypothetical protein
MGDRPLTLDELRNAVSDLQGALLEHRILDDEQWDEAIATLLTGREQHGGRIRHLIHTILDVGRRASPAGALPAALSELHCHLALADDPAPPSHHHRRPTAPLRQHRRNPLRSAQQLRLFDSDERS